MKSNRKRTRNIGRQRREMTDILRRRPKEAKKKRQKREIVGILYYNKHIFGTGEVKKYQAL